jgi:hypothetical protein
MPQIELKDLTRSLNTESFLEDLTNEAVNIVGGRLDDTIIPLALTASHITLTCAKEYRNFIEATLENLHAAENSVANYTVFYTISQSNATHGSLVFQTFSTGNLH